MSMALVQWRLGAPADEHAGSTCAASEAASGKKNIIVHNFPGKSVDVTQATGTVRFVTRFYFEF
jgi:hypothetical protein